MARKIKLLLTIGLLAGLAGLTILKLESAKSSHIPFGNTSGWVWSASNDGASNCTPAFPYQASPDCGGIGWININASSPLISPFSHTSSVSYGLNIPDNDGDITGFIWSDNLGWINFGSASAQIADNNLYPGCGFPSAPCQDVRSSNDTLIGWAKILSISEAFNGGNNSNSGGNVGSPWEGWIKFYGNSGNPCTPSTNCTVKIVQNNSLTTPFTHTLEGYAWSDLGWLKFGPPTPPDLTYAPKVSLGPQIIQPPPPPPVGPPPPSGGPPPPPLGFIASCNGSPNPALLSNGGKVNWTGIAIGGTGPYEFDWAFDSDANPKNSNSNPIIATYGSTGIKNADLTVTDADDNTTTATCNITVRRFKIFEFIPF